MRFCSIPHVSYYEMQCAHDILIGSMQDLLSPDKTSSEILIRLLFTFGHHYYSQEKVGKPSETDSIKSQISSEKKTAQKDNIIDITSDSQVNSNFPYRWSSASLTFNIYFYLFLYLYIMRITINNNTPHLKSPKNQNGRATLGRPAMKLLGGFNKFAVDQPSPLVLLWVLRHFIVWLAWKIPSS